MAVAVKTSQERMSYRSILKSTSLIGGASLLNMLIGMIRTKFVAMLLGPTGVGLISMYAQITTLITTMTGLGLSNSGVRQVAEAVGSNDDDRISSTVTTVRRTSWLTGCLGLFVMIVFCMPISRITFDTNDYAWPIALLGVTVLMSAITSGQGCIINGTRRIGDLAKISIIGAINVTIVSIPCFYLWGTAGIVPSLILSAFATLATSWWFARRVLIKTIAFSWRDSYQEARQLLSFGASFMGAALFTALTAFLIRVIMLRQFGLTDVGIYQAAFNLSGILVGFVLGAMGADYYPRLTAVASDNAIVYRMVNEQLQVSILLALPCLAAMMIFAPLIINIFYAASFTPAVSILRWCIFGILGRVFSWPMGFVMLAKGKGKLYFLTEVSMCGVHLAAVFVFIQIYYLDGAGIAFMILYIVYVLLTLFIMQRLVGATLTYSNLKLIIIATMVIIILMVNNTLNNNKTIIWTINIVSLVSISLFCIKCLVRKSGISLESILTKIIIKR